MIIRPVTLADLDAVHAMILELSTYHGDVASITMDALERDVLGTPPWIYVLVAEHEGTLIGYAALVPRARFHKGERAMDVHHLFVAECQRGKGIGNQLLDAACAKARTLGCTLMAVGADRENKDAQRLYETYGFNRIELDGALFRLPLV